MDKPAPLAISPPIPPPVPPPPQVRPWDRLAHETEPAWRAWQIHRDSSHTGTPRTLRRTGELAGLAVSTVAEMSQRYDWTARCVAYDRHQDAARQQAVAEVQAAQAREQARIADKLVKIVAREVDRLEELQANGVEMGSLKEVVAALERVQSIGRLALGQSTENHAHAHVHRAAAPFVADLSQLTYPELLTLRELLEKCGVEPAAIERPPA